MAVRLSEVAKIGSQNANGEAVPLPVVAPPKLVGAPPKRTDRSMEITKKVWDDTPANRKRRIANGQRFILAQTDEGMRWVPVFWRH
jgi:hypothetical protein